MIVEAEGVGHRLSRIRKKQTRKEGKTLELDVFAAIDYLKGEGAERVSLLGAVWEEGLLVGQSFRTRHAVDREVPWRASSRFPEES